MNRRGFFGVLAGAAAFALDPERALWVLGAKTISIPPAARRFEVGYLGGDPVGIWATAHHLPIDVIAAHLRAEGRRPNIGDTINIRMPRRFIMVDAIGVFPLPDHFALATRIG